MPVTGRMTAPAVFAATLAADVGGVFAAGAGPDKKGTLERLKALRRELFDPKIAEHHGRIVKSFAKCSPQSVLSRVNRQGLGYWVAGVP